MQYFIKNLAQADRAAIERHGLAYAFDDHIASSQPPSGGPMEAGRGSYVSRSDVHIGNLPGYQWVPISESVLFGWKPGAEPSTYARPSQLPGELVTMADGNQWMVPTAYEWHVIGDGPRMTTNLPRSWAYSDNQWMPGDVLAKYSKLWSSAVEVANKYFGAADKESAGVTIADVFNMTALALQANYYVSPVECGLLGILSDTKEVMSGVINAVFGMKRLEELEKKTA
jgi:hypothetical protein